MCYRLTGRHLHLPQTHFHMEPEGKGARDEVVLGAGGQGWGLTGAEGTALPELGGGNPHGLDTDGRWIPKQHLEEKAAFTQVQGTPMKKAEHQRTDAFELWCWRRLLRVPWSARRSNQSILKEISPECSLAGLMLKRKLQYFGHLMRRADLFEKILMAGKD